MKLIPASRAAVIIACGWSVRPHQSVTSVQVPNPTSETTRSLWPNRRYRMNFSSSTTPAILPIGLAIFPSGGAHAVAEHDGNREYHARRDETDCGHDHGPARERRRDAGKEAGDRNRERGVANALAQGGEPGDASPTDEDLVVVHLALQPCAMNAWSIAAGR